MNNTSNGIPSLTSALVAMLGLLAAMHPKWAILVALSQHVPELREILPYLLTTIGALGASIAHPPAWLRDPIVDAWHTLKSLARFGDGEVPPAGPTP